MTTESDFYVHPDWKDAIEQAGLLDFETHYKRRDASCLSLHKRGWVYRAELADGRRVFVKFDALTLPKRIWGDLLRLTKPQPLTFRERVALERLAAENIGAPKVLAWRQRRGKFGLPHQAIMVLSELQGTSIESYLKSQTNTDLRRRALVAAGGTIGKLFSRGLHWPDLGVDHVFVTPDMQVGFLDVDRLAPRKAGLEKSATRQLRTLVGELAGLGADHAEISAFLQTVAAELKPPLAQKVANLATR